MHGEREEEVSSLFFELAGDLRYSTLMKLRNRSYRLSHLAEELNATMQETHRNISRLVSSNLVTKGQEGDLVTDTVWRINCFTNSKLRLHVSE